MNTEKSLKEQVSEILSSKDSKATMRVKLAKLNLTPFDISVLLDTLPKATRAKTEITFSSLTFGVEIECVNCLRDSLILAASNRSLDVRSEGYNHRDNKQYIKIVSDSSIMGANPNEVVTHVLKGKKGLNTLHDLCDSLTEIGAGVNRSCGLHVHFGCTQMTDEWYITIFNNYKMCKRVIDSFLAPSRRGEEARWCKGLGCFNFDRCNTIADVYRLMGGRYYCVNPEAWQRHRTIEFRQHQGTIDYKKISTWVEFLASLIIYSYNNRLSSVVTSIDDIPFIKKSMKRYLNDRKTALNG